MPKQSESQVIGHEGERWFAAQLPASWIPQFPTTDIGVDALVIICDEGPLNGLEFRVQIKSARKWHIQSDCILVKGFSKRSLIDLLRGFTPALLVLYEASTKSGHCFWVNQLLAMSPHLAQTQTKSLTLKVPKLRPIEATLWPQLASEVRGVSRAIGRRVSLSGVYVSILEATHALMQSLYLIDLCATGGNSNITIADLLNGKIE